MAEFLTRSGCIDAIEQMARQSKDKLWLISPFIKITDSLKELLEDKDRDRIDMRLVYGKRELREGELEWLESLASLRMYYRENLHAKCYMTEDVALITSMNLYEFSLIHNDEWGILVSRSEDKELYQRIFAEAQRLFRRSEIPSSVKAPKVAHQSTPEVAQQPTAERTPSAPPAQTKTANRPRKRAVDRKPSLPKMGVCIRGGEPIDFNILKPYCYTCFGVWNSFQNREYKENKCHACGRDWETDIDRPLCLDCLRRYAGLLVAQGHGFRQPENGVCIRDGAAIGFDMSNPYCGKCFRSWNRYKNREYEEKMCHMCGRENPSTMERPICPACCLNVEYIAFTQALGDGYATPPIQYYDEYVQDDENIWDFLDDDGFPR